MLTCLASRFGGVLRPLKSGKLCRQKAYGLKSVLFVAAGLRRCRRGRGPFPLLLPERAMPRPRQAGAGNLTVCARYGKEQHRLLYCRTCRYRFSERKGTPLFGSQLPDDKAVSLFEHLAERNGVRATARLVGVNRNTVVRYSRLAGAHARHLHDEFVAFSPSNPRGPVR